MILPGLRLIVIVVKKNLPWTLATTLLKLKMYQNFLSIIYKKTIIKIATKRFFE